MKLGQAAGALVLMLCGLPAFGQSIEVDSAFARASGPTAKAGAAFMEVRNLTESDDVLLGARSDVAARVELHTHEAGSDGVMKMIKLEEGIAIPAGGSHSLERGKDHVMFMGLKEPFLQDETITVILEFEKAGDVEIQIPVDLTQ